MYVGVVNCMFEYEKGWSSAPLAKTSDLIPIVVVVVMVVLVSGSGSHLFTLLCALI